MAVRVTRAGVALTVGIIVLAGLIVGGLLWAKEMGEQARRDEAIQIANQNLEERSNDGALNEGEENEGTEGTEGTATDRPARDDTQQAPVVGSGNPQEVTELPRTGPESSLFSILIVALLAFTGASYLRSRQQLNRLK